MNTTLFKENLSIYYCRLNKSSESLPEVIAMRKIFHEHLKRNRLRYALLFGVGGVGSFAFYESHCEYTPITNRKRFMPFSSNRLKEIENIDNIAGHNVKQFKIKI